LEESHPWLSASIGKNGGNQPVGDNERNGDNERYKERDNEYRVRNPPIPPILLPPADSDPSMIERDPNPPIPGQIAPDPSDSSDPYQKREKRALKRFKWLLRVP